MMRRALVLASTLLTAGCYHATVNTGLVSPTPQATTTKTMWVHSWIYGVVPPKEINAVETCGGQAAQVATQLSFPNQLVGVLTLGIYTPMTVAITCTPAADKAAK